MQSEIFLGNDTKKKKLIVAKKYKIFIFRSYENFNMVPVVNGLSDNGAQLLTVDH